MQFAIFNKICNENCKFREQGDSCEIGLCFKKISDTEEKSNEKDINNK